MTGGSTDVQSSTYRRDLDGLRGIAIGLVVLYPVFVGGVSGGVDVFLLLSGYFFLGFQLRYATPCSTPGGRSGAPCAAWAEGTVRLIVSMAPEAVVPTSTRPADAGPDDANYRMLRVLDGGAGYVDSDAPVTACPMLRASAYADEDPAAAVLAGRPRTQAVDTADTCPPVIGNIPVMRDQNHISNAYALSAADLLWPHLERAFTMRST